MDYFDSDGDLRTKATFSDEEEFISRGADAFNHRDESLDEERYDGTRFWESKDSFGVHWKGSCFSDGTPITLYPYIIPNKDKYKNKNKR